MVVGQGLLWASDQLASGVVFTHAYLSRSASYRGICTCQLTDVKCSSTPSSSTSISLHKERLSLSVVDELTL